LRSQYSLLTEQGATVIGVVGQDSQAIADFLERTPLPFVVLGDEDRAVIKAYNVYNALNIDAFRVAHPSVFIVDPDGAIQYCAVASNQRDWIQTDALANELAAARGRYTSTA
jgi:peroxiredoxin